ncbi:MAG TPA: hypothetical protein VGC24_04215 [Burkholderiaceae bacterium]
MSGSNLSDVPAACVAPSPEPLALVVHAMPTPQAVARSAMRRQWKLLAVLLVCVAPVVASYFTYYVLRPAGRSAYGVLIEPQRPLPDLPARGLDGQPVAGGLRALAGQWLLVSVAGGGCDAACQNNLYLQRQLRESLGRDKERMDWVWLVSDDTPIAPALRPGLQSATVLRVEGAALAQWLQPAAGHALPEHLYLVDPQGHWMLRFPANMDAAGASKARRDLDRLLRAAAGWDEAGRPPPPPTP